MMKVASMIKMPLPGASTAKRRQHCTLCKNHGLKVLKNGHVCKLKRCKCKLCALTTKAQIAMRYQQALWRHQGRQLAKDRTFQMSGLSSRQLCDKCRNHNIFCKKRGHKAKCQFEKCKCAQCNLTDKRRLVMKHQQRVRRANVTSHAVSDDSGEESDDDDGPTEQDDAPTTPPDDENSIIGAIEAVTKAIDNLPEDSIKLPFTPCRSGSRKKLPRNDSPPRVLPMNNTSSNHAGHSPISDSFAKHEDARQLSPPMTCYNSSSNNYGNSFVSPPSVEAGSSRPWHSSHLPPALQTDPSYAPHGLDNPLRPNVNPSEGILSIKHEVKEEDTWCSSGDSGQAVLPPHSSYLPAYLPPPPPPLDQHSKSLLNPMPPHSSAMSKPYYGSPPYDTSNINNSSMKMANKMSQLRLDAGASNYSYQGSAAALSRSMGSGESSDPCSALARRHNLPPAALEGLSLFIQRHYPEQFPMSSNNGAGYYPAPQVRTSHQQMPSTLRLHPHQLHQVAAASTLRNIIHPYPLRQLPPDLQWPNNISPYQPSFNPLLHYSSVLLPRANMTNSIESIYDKTYLREIQR